MLIKKFVVSKNGKLVEKFSSFKDASACAKKYNLSYLTDVYKVIILRR
jgi:glutathione peroxidase-family protein